MITVLRAVRLRRLGLATLLAVAAETCSVGLIALSAWLIARAAQQPSIAVLGTAIAGVRAFATSRGAFRYAERLAGHDVALRAVSELRGKVYDAIADRPHRTRDGDGLARLVTDTESVQDLLLRCLVPTAVAATMAAGSVVLCTALLPSAGLALSAGVFLTCVVLPAAASVASSRSGPRITAARAELSVQALDLVAGSRDLAAFGATGRARDRAHAQAQRLAKTERRAAQVAGLTKMAGVLLQGLTVAAVTWTAVQSGSGTVRVAVLGLTALAAVEAVLPVGDAAQTWMQVRPAAARVGELLRSAPGAPRSARYVESPGDIELRDVHFSFDSRTALDAVDLSVAYGRSVAVVGASGAGKSTLLNILAGLATAQSGSVRIPRSRALTQDAHVFHATLRANLLLGRPDATAEQLMTALHLAGLTDWFDELPDGLETTVGEVGGHLSGGQRQRLVLARALLADPATLLLDEPVEGLDLALADDVMRRVLDARGGRTTVVVTHRLAPLHAFDQVMVMDRGRIVARGTHDHLISRPGPYRDLWDAEQLVESARTGLPPARPLAPVYETTCE